MAIKNEPTAIHIQISTLLKWINAWLKDHYAFNKRIKVYSINYKHTKR